MMRPQTISCRVLTRFFRACYNAPHISNDGKSTLVGVLSEPGIVRAGGWRPAEDHPGAADRPSH